MGAILKTFKIDLSPEQAQAIREAYMPVAQMNRCMLVIQPIGMTNPEGVVDGRTPHLNCAVLDETLALALNALLKQHKEARP